MIQNPFNLDISNTILIIDEDEAMQLVLQATLNRFIASGKIKTAFDGKEALEYLEKHASENNFPKLIIASLTMKEGSGLEFIKALKAMKGYSPKKTEIFIVVPEIKQEVMQELQEIGVDKILPRPELPAGFNNLKL